MRRIILSRLAYAVPTFFIMTFFIFSLASLVPGDVASVILGDQATPDRIEALTTELGLDRPVIVQYWMWLSGAAHGDLGTSIYTGQTVSSVIAFRFWPTFWIAFLATAIATLVGVSIGMLTALRRGPLGRSLDSISLFFTSLPSFWLGFLLMIVFAGALRWVPAIGYTPLEVSPSQWIAHLALPVTVYTLVSLAPIAKQTRDAYGEALSRDYIRFMQANGIPRSSLIFRHALRTSSVRIVATIGLTFMGTFTGTAAVELVFAVPGLGLMLAQASLNHDLALIQGGVLAMTLIILVVSLVSDVLYAILNPKVGAK